MFHLAIRLCSRHSSRTFTYGNAHCKVFAFHSLKASSSGTIKCPFRAASFTRWRSTEANQQTKEGMKYSPQSKQSQDQATTKKLTTKQSLKVITTQYGAFGMVFYSTITLGLLGLIYCLLTYSGIDFTPLISWLGIENSILGTGTSTFIVACAINKVFTPARIGMTLVSVPFLVKHFRKIGLFKK